MAAKKAKVTNVSKVSVNKTKVSLKAGKIFTLKVTYKKQNSKKKLLSHVNKYRFYTSDSSVATVNSKGKITAKAKGTCYVYVVANNGRYRAVKVTVK